MTRLLRSGMTAPGRCYDGPTGMRAGGRKRLKRLVAACAPLLALLGVLLPVSPAAANPPKLESVGASGGLVSASWSLTPGVRSEFFEIARYPDVNVYGYFRQKLDDGSESQVRFGVLGASQTSLTAEDPEPPLEAGTYYIHIAGHDNSCSGCPQIEFSETVEVVIAAAGNATATKVVAPGTSGGPVAGDKTAPTANLRYTRRQDIDKLRVRARMSEPGTLTARALVDVGGLLARIYNFRPVRRKVTGGVLTTLKPRLSRKNKRALKRALRKGKKLRARVTITATDRAGNKSTLHATIRLRP
jgi:hypothetical protein